MPLVS